MTVIATPPTLVEVRRVESRGKGSRGVFARQTIGPGTVIEHSPVLLIPRDQVFGDADFTRRQTAVSWYAFEWQSVTKTDHVALGLGYLSLYNHAVYSNATFEQVWPDQMKIVAVQIIEAGEEVTINYLGDPGVAGDVGFDVRG